MAHFYRRLSEAGKLIHCPKSDFEGKHTGKIILNLPAYFDENEAERIALGWQRVNIEDKPAYNEQTQYLQACDRPIDEHTVRRTYMVMEKTEEMLLMEEINGTYGLPGYLMEDWDINAAYQNEPQ